LFALVWGTTPSPPTASPDRDAVVA
jgi:hypothetical protein